MSYEKQHKCDTEEEKWVLLFYVFCWDGRSKEQEARKLLQEQQKKSKHEEEKQSGKVREREKGIANWKAKVDVVIGT